VEETLFMQPLSMRRPAPFTIGSLVIAIAVNDVVTTSHALISLPQQLQETVAKGLLVQPRGRPDVFVLGTVHVGSESAREASLLIETVRPSTLVVEVAPSRLSIIRKRNKESQKQSNVDEQIVSSEETDSAQETNDDKGASSIEKVQIAIRSLPALAAKGWNSGGPGGLIFAVTILWGSLLKRSLTATEESDNLPRADEFAAAIAAADDVGCNVICADMEIEELIGSIARSMSMPVDYLSLGLNILRESLGLQEGDPIRRKKNESLVQWAKRRRNIDTARASRAHGEVTAPCISRVLVHERDGLFAESCMKASRQLHEDEQEVKGYIGGCIVCVVGLVHLDGVVKRLTCSQ